MKPSTTQPSHPQHQAHPVIIDPTSYPADHPMSVALRLVSRHWFLAYSKLMSMRWEWTTATPYGATDGARLLLNRQGLEKLARQPNGVGLTAFLLVHEALHALLGHGWRCAGMKDKHTANVAADYVINAMIDMRNKELRAAVRGLNHDVFPFIDGVLLDRTLSGDKSVEQLYRELVKPAPPQPQTPQPQPDTNDEQDKQDSDDDDTDDSCESGDGDAEGDDADGDDTPDPSDGGEGSADEDADDEGGPSGAAGDGPAPDDTGADHPSGGGAGDTGAPDTGADQGDDDDLSDFVGTGAPDTLAPEPGEGETQQEAIDRIEEDNDRILIQDEIDRRTSGTTGACGQRAAEMRKERSGLDWVDLTREWLTKRAPNGWDSPFNRVLFQTTGLVCAGRRSRMAGVVVLALDTSGSIGQETYAKFLRNGQEILDDLKPELLVLLSVSHYVADSYMLEPGDTVPASMKGGGGTLFKPAFDWLTDNDIEPDVMIYLTDGLASDRTTLTPVDYPLLWLSTQVKAAAFPIGDVIEITNV